MLDQYFRSTHSSDKYIPSRIKRRRYLGVNFDASSVPLAISVFFYASHVVRVYALFEKKTAQNDTRSGGIFISTIRRFAISNGLANSQFGCESSASGASRPASSRPPAPKIRVRRGGGDVSAKRRKTQPQECYFNHRATKKKSHSENIYLLYRGKRRVQSWKRASRDQCIVRGLLIWRRRRPPCGIRRSVDASLISIAFKR